MKSIPYSLLALLMCSTSASAQLSDRITERVGTRFPVQFLLLPPMPDEACVFTDENMKGSRYCFKAQENGALPGSHLWKVSSFIVPFGYELELYQTKVTTSPNDQEPKLLCRMMQIDANMAYNGAVRLNGGCSDDPAADNRATSVSFRKMPSITDAQRKAAWQKWPAIDDQFCAVKFWPGFPFQSDKITKKFDELGREFCFGTFADMRILAEHSWSKVPAPYNWEKLLSGVLIRNRSVQIKLFEYRNFRGESVTLTCGRHELGFLSSKIASVQITLLPTPVPACTDSPSPLRTWDSGVAPG